MLLIGLVVFGYFAGMAWLLTKMMESENPTKERGKWQHPKHPEKEKEP